MVRAAGRDRPVSGAINPFPEATMFTAFDLHVFAARRNPRHCKAPHQNTERFAVTTLTSGVTATRAEFDHRTAPNRIPPLCSG